MNEFHFSATNLEQSLTNLSKQGITEVTVNDFEITKNRSRLLNLLKKINTIVPDIHFDFVIEHTILDREIVNAFAEIFCSLLIIMPENIQDDIALRKGFSKKINLLNEFGIVFGFSLQASLKSFKAFSSLIDFAISLYPNDLEFDYKNLVPTGTLSTLDIKKIQAIAYSFEVFYTAGRAVPWFLIALQPLKIHAVQFFSDFSEWLQCNNCTKNENFSADNVSQSEIEKMQIHFLKLKYEEKKILPIFNALENLVKLHGAFSRVAAEDEETVLEISYDPNDLLSYEVCNLVSFVENVCMEPCKVRIFAGEFEPEIEII